MNAILTRRSIRKFTDQVVDDDKVNELLEAAMCAPSAGDSAEANDLACRGFPLHAEAAKVDP